MDKEKLFIYYFSGTGNAYNVSKWIKDVALKLSFDTRLLDISKEGVDSESLKEKHTIIGFASPTHGFNFPPITFHFLLRFPKGQGQHVFIVNTRAGMKMGKFFLPGLSGMAQYLSALIMMLKGYKVIGMHPIDLPSNWISFHPGLKAKVVHSIYERRKRETIKFAEKVLGGKKDLRAVRDLLQDLLITPIGILYYFFGRFMLAKSFIASADCNDCGLCIKSCPLQAIKKVNDRPYWTYKCESCMKCMNNCPERAIETAHGFLVLIGWLVNAFVLFYSYKYLNLGIWFHKSGFLPYITEVVFDSTVFLICLILSYKVIHYLKRLRIVEKLVTFTSLTKYPFWRRYNPRRLLKEIENSLNVPAEDG